MASDWYYMEHGQVAGPVSATELQALAQQGKILADTQVTKGSDSTWVAASKVKGLAFPHPAPPGHSAPITPPPSPPTRSAATERELTCPHCNQGLVVEEEASGTTVPCPHCRRPLIIPPAATGVNSARRKQVGRALESISERVESGIDDVIQAFIGEEQDPTFVQEIHAKVVQLLTKDEKISYIAMQNKPLVNVRPDAIVLTNRRVIVYRSRLFGRVDFHDLIWRDLADAKLKEGIMGATLTFQTTDGATHALDYVPKPQARRAYAIAQEMEERVREERRLRTMEERRAAAGGVIIQGGLAQGPSGASAPSEDPVQKLKQLKDMLDAGLITQGEFEAKRQAILARM